MRPLVESLAVALVVAWSAPPVAHAVPAGQVSWTAAAVCELRAISAQHPDPRLRNRDELADRFCRPLMLPRDYDAAREVMDDNPEAYASYFYVNARTHHIDDWVDRAAADGALQVVVLGAGFDSRAYRFAARYPKLVFFEVDLPATIDAKQRAVERVFGALPAYVRYVPIDFDTQTLDRVLTGAGYDPQRKSLFILEGVTMYVSEAGNDASFEFIRRHAAAGSTVVFDYVERRVVDGDFTGLYAVGAEAKGVARMGEPFITGWAPAQAAAFAQHHGLIVLDNLDAAALTRRYLIGTDGQPDGRPPDGYGLIDARLP